VHDEESVSNGQGFGEVRVVPEEIVGIADSEKGGDDLEMQFGGEGFDALDVLKVMGVHFLELRELGIAEENVGVADFGRASEESFECVDVFIDRKILRTVEPAFEGLGWLSQEEPAKEDEVPQAKGEE